MTKLLTFSVVLLVSLASLQTSARAEDDVILPATAVEGFTNVVLVFIQGAQLEAARYTANVQAIQADAVSYKLSVWAAIPAITFDLPILPAQVEAAVTRVLGKLNAPADAPLFIAGHSLGATGAMAYANNHSETVKGALLYGASLLRKYGDNFPVPYLQVNGEMDGLQRPSRVAEAYYRHIIHTNDPRSVLASGVALLKGVSHLQFADGQNAPGAVLKLDLQPTVSQDEARAAIAQVSAAFVAATLLEDEDAVSILKKAVLQDSADFLSPLIDVMLNQEGNPHLRPSCDSDHPSPQCPFYPAWPPQNGTRTPSNNTDCTCQVLWANTAAVMMAGLPDGYTISAVNSIHDVTDTKPYHHAHIWNNCTGPCVLNVTTVAQLTFPTFDDWDTGFTQATASEIRVKMKSRQAAFQQSGFQPNADLNVTDAPSICASINQAAYQYALDHSSEEARTRFLQYGQPIVFADDKPVFIPVGPLWIYNPLKLDQVQQNGQWVLRAASPSMKTPVDGWITKLYPDSNGYHYCKLLSPARAMEWIYTDGLRRQLGLQNTTSTL